MADVTIDASTRADPQWRGFNAGPHWKTDQIGYRFYVDSNTDLVYSKTTDGGATWGAAVTVMTTGETTNGYVKFCCWFDKETTGDSGTKIHVLGIDRHNGRARYRTLDISSDTLGTEVTVATITSVTGAGGGGTANWWDLGWCSITKARGGNLYALFRDNATDSFPTTTATWVFYRSTDGGATWSSRTTTGLAFTGAGNFGRDAQAILLPANDTDNQDIAVLYLRDDFNTPTVSIRFQLHDDSANSWGSSTTIDTLTGSPGGGDFADPIWFADATIRHSDGKAIVLAWETTDYDAGFTSNTLHAYALTLTAAGAAASALTDVVTASEAAECAVFIDQANDDLYAVYLKGGTYYSSVDVYYKKSTDDGSTWGTETKFNTTAGNYQHVHSGHGVKSGESGRFCPSFDVTTANDVLTNAGNSVAITTGGGPAPTNDRFFFAA